MEKMRIRLGSIDQIPIGHGTCFIVGSHEVAVFRTRSGNLFAIENQCPHLGGPLVDGIVGDNKVICSLHGHKFDLVTGQGSDAHECVKTFKVWEENKNIFILFNFSAKKIESEACRVN